MSRIAAIQMNSGLSVENNLQTAAQLIAQAVAKKAKVIVLPEMFALLGKTYLDKINIRESFGHGLIQDFLAKQAAQYKIWLIGGTIPLATHDPHKVRAACLVYNSEGKCVARYDKIHLFDVCVIKGIEEHCESRATEHGNDSVVIETPVGKLGLAVCYDVRFPELFRNLLTKGVELFVIPTAFTKKTGKAHWELLTRARAVENFCYVIAACQTGKHENGRESFGHSLIIDPWGKIVSCLPTGTGVIDAEIDLKKLHQIRQDFPAIRHRRIF